MQLSFPASNLTSIGHASVLGRVRIELDPQQRSDFKSASSQELLRAASNGCVLSSFPLTKNQDVDSIEQAAIGWLNSSAEVVVLEGEEEIVAAVAERLPRARVFYRVAQGLSLDNAATVLSTSLLNNAVGGFEVPIESQDGDEDKFVQACQTLRDALKRDDDVNHGYGHGHSTELFVVPTTEDFLSLPSSVAGRLDKIGVRILLDGRLNIKGLPSSNASTSSSSEIENENTVRDVGLNLVGCLRTDRPDGLFATVVCDECGVALGLVYSSVESIRESIKTGRGVYYSRSRKGLWRKGETSGAIQELVSISYDCDGDALRYVVRQLGSPPSFCHTGNRSCWGPSKGLRALQEVLQSRLASAPEGSYTRRLYNDEGLLRNKLLEEAQELSEAKETDHVAAEAADVIYFTLVAAVKGGASLEEIEGHLDRRTLKIKRRPGNAKPERIAAAAAELEAMRAAKRRKLEK